MTKLRSKYDEIKDQTKLNFSSLKKFSKLSLKIDKINSKLKL